MVLLGEFQVSNHICADETPAVSSGRMFIYVKASSMSVDITLVWSKKYAVAAQ